MTTSPLFTTCPVPTAETERVLLGHGSGGQLSAELLRDVILPGYGLSASEHGLGHRRTAGPGLEGSGPAGGQSVAIGVRPFQISERCFCTKGSFAHIAPRPRRLPTPKAAIAIRARASSTWSSTN